MRCSRRFQIISDAPRVILDVAHNPHAAAYLAGRLKTLAKTGRVLAVIGMLHDKDIAGTLANLAPEVDASGTARRWKGRAAPRQSSWWNILRCGTVISSVAQAWRAAMADAKAEDDRAGVWFFPHRSAGYGRDRRGENRWRVSFRTV